MRIFYAQRESGACQADPTTSYHANVEIPVWLAKAAKKRKLICFSSDQVYNGCEEDGPYTETDATPASVYAEHKLLMEQRVLDILPEAVMLRAEWMYDYYPARPNYFMNVINASESLSVSFRQFRGLTYLREVAENMHSIFALPGGSYNFGSETSKTMYEITVEFLDYLGKDIKLVDTSLRHNLWMNCDKAKQYGVSFSDVSQGLIKCARDYGYGQV